MPYTVGSRHVLSGAGQVSVSTPVGLRVALSGIPAYVSETFSTPPEYFDVGTLTLGNSDGWLPAHFLHYVNTLIYPLQDSLTLLAFTLAGSTVATVDELLSGPVVAPPAGSFGSSGFGLGAFGG